MPATDPNKPLPKNGVHSVSPTYKKEKRNILYKKAIIHLPQKQVDSIEQNTPSDSDNEIDEIEYSDSEGSEFELEEENEEETQLEEETEDESFSDEDIDFIFLDEHKNEEEEDSNSWEIREKNKERNN